MSEMLKKVGAAILLAQSRWNPKTAREPLERVMARAAIEAMREPTEAMNAIGAGAYANGDPEDTVSPSGIRDAYRAMIDEALK